MFKNTDQKLNIHMETLSAIFVIILVSLFIVVNLFMGFILPLYLVAMGASFLIVFFYPRSGLYAIIFLTMIFERFFALVPLVIGKIEYKLYPLDIIIIAILLGILFSFLTKEKRTNAIIKKIDLLLVVFIVLNFVYYFVGVYFLKSDIALSFSTLKNYAFYSLLFFIASYSITNRAELRRLFGFYFFGAIAIIALILFGIINGVGLWTGYTPLSTEGVRLLAFTHGVYVTVAFLSAIVYLIYRKQERNKSGFLYLLILIWLVGIVGTMMRHIWGNIIIFFFLLYVLISKVKKVEFRKVAFNFFLIFVSCVLVAFYVALIFPQSEVSKQISNVNSAIIKRGASLENINDDDSFAWRRMAWKAAFTEFSENPIFGIGTGRKVYIEKQDYQAYVEVKSIHNSYISILIQMGFLGIIIFLSFVFAVLKKLIASSGSDEYAFYKFSILAVLLINLLGSFFQPYLEVNLNNMFFWIGLGLVNALVRINRQFE